MVGWPPLRPDSARCALYGFRRGAPASRSALAAARQRYRAVSSAPAADAEAVWPLLNTGGELLYSTCSVFPEEGEAQARAFERAASDAVRLPAPGQLLPSVTQAEQNHDGFFYARFLKR